MTLSLINWQQTCSYNPKAKRAFHRAARVCLRRLATLLNFPLGSFDLRSNQGGVVVSGEITLHHEHVYVQVSQSCMGSDHGILIRKCEGRNDYTGGDNNFAPLRLLNDPAELAKHVREVMGRNQLD